MGREMGILENKIFKALAQDADPFSVLFFGCPYFMGH